jgi:succinoglycan biosynthesis protein ExoA
LADLVRQDFPREYFEVLVVDGQSTDNTVQVASEFKDKFHSLRIIDNPEKLSSAARDIGYRESSGRYILYVDGHCRIDSNRLLSEMVDLFERHDVHALCRPQPLTAGPQTRFQQAVSLARASTLGHAPDSTIYRSAEGIISASSSGAMYRREVFSIVGSFDHSFDACEDVEFNTRIDKAGLKAMISPALEVKYAARRSFADLFCQLYRYGQGRWRLFVKHPNKFSIGIAGALIVIAGLLMLPFAWIAFPRAGFVLTLFLLVYMIAVLLESCHIAVRYGMSLILLLPAVFFTIHIASGLGFLAGAVHAGNVSRA